MNPFGTGYRYRRPFSAVFCSCFLVVLLCTPPKLCRGWLQRSSLDTRGPHLFGTGSNPWTKLINTNGATQTPGATPLHGWRVTAASGANPSPNLGSSGAPTRGNTTAAAERTGGGGGGGGGGERWLWLRPWTSALYFERRVQRSLARRRRSFREDLRNNLAVIGTILHYLWPRRGPRGRAALCGAVVCLLLGKLVGVRVPFLLQRAIDGMPGRQGAASVPLALFAMYGLGRTLSTLLSEAKNLLFAYVSQAAQREYALKIFGHLHLLDSTFHQGHPTGLLSVAYVRGIRGFQTILFQIVFTILPTLLEVGLVGAIFLRTCGPLYAAATLLTFVAYCAFTVAMTEKRVVLRRQLVAVDNKRTAFFVDSFANHEVVKLFNNEDRELAQFDGYLGRILDTTILNTWSVAALNLGQTAIFSAGLTTILLLAATRVAAGTMSIGQLVAINGLLMQLSIPFNYIGFTYQELRQGFVDMEVLVRLLAQVPSVRDTGAGALGPVAQAYDEATQKPLVGEVVFDSVSFKYPNTSTYILNNISFTIPPTEDWALVGPSGCGKSTILKLLSRLFEVTSGRILIDGQDIRNVSLSSLREHIGFVPQDTTLFDGTVRDNIKYGKPNATDAEMAAAALRANVHATVAGLPEGYAARVGERGARLSGGERQRVSLARALIRDPTIMLYDEVTSALDTFVEREIMDELRAIAHNRTTLTVAHRLSSVVDADRIVVLDRGALVEQGGHDDLLTRPGGVYARMWELQRAGVYSDVGRPGVRKAPAHADFAVALQHPTLPMETGAGFVSSDLGPIPEKYDRMDSTHSIPDMGELEDWEKEDPYFSLVSANSSSMSS